jgi:hypothetical protein
MMNRATIRRALILVASLASAAPAGAQTRVYASGDFFAEAMKLSRTTVTPELVDGPPDVVSPEDGVTVGGGARTGAFFAPAWSLEFGFDAGRSIADERTRGLGNTSGLLIPPRRLQFTSRTSQRFTAASVLVGYHPFARGRIHPGFRGGVSFMHTEREFTLASFSTVMLTPTVPGGAIVSSISLITNQYTTVTNGLTATVAAEAAIELSEHFGVVPEVRAHAGGIGAILLRPGVAVRWRW